MQHTDHTMQSVCDSMYTLQCCWPPYGLTTAAGVNCLVGQWRWQERGGEGGKGRGGMWVGSKKWEGRGGRSGEGGEERNKLGEEEREKWTRDGRRGGSERRGKLRRFTYGTEETSNKDNTVHIIAVD